MHFCCLLCVHFPYVQFSVLSSIVLSCTLFLLSSRSVGFVLLSHSFLVFCSSNTCSSISLVLVFYSCGSCPFQIMFIFKNYTPQNIHPYFKYIDNFLNIMNLSFQGFVNKLFENVWQLISHFNSFLISTDSKDNFAVFFSFGLVYFAPLTVSHCA